MRTKAILPIFRFLLLLLPVVPLCFAVSIQVKQKIIYSSMREKVKTDLLQTISLKEEEVHWVKYGKEILINDCLFDIKSFSVQNGVAVFLGLFDFEETVLFKQIKKDHQNESGSRQITNLFKILQTFYNNTDEILTFNGSHVTKKYPACISSSLLTPFIPLFIPPPQV